MGLEPLGNNGGGDSGNRISKVLSDGESVTVPAGKEWEVVINCAPVTAAQSNTFDPYDSIETDRTEESIRILVDGVYIAGTDSTTESQTNEPNSSASATAQSTVPFTAAFTEGQTISVSGGGALITGKEYDA